MPEPKLERNSNLQEWQWVYLEQEAAFLSEKYKKVRDKQKSNKKHWKKPENRILNRNIL